MARKAFLFCDLSSNCIWLVVEQIKSSTSVIFIIGIKINLFLTLCDWLLTDYKFVSHLMTKYVIRAELEVGPTQEPLRHQSADISANRSKDDAERAVTENDNAFYEYLN